MTVEQCGTFMHLPPTSDPLTKHGPSVTGERLETGSPDLFWKAQKQPHPVRSYHTKTKESNRPKTDATVSSYSTTGKLPVLSAPIKFPLFHSIRYPNGMPGWKNLRLFSGSIFSDR